MWMNGRCFSWKYDDNINMDIGFFFVFYVETVQIVTKATLEGVVDEILYQVQIYFDQKGSYEKENVFSQLGP